MTEQLGNSELSELLKSRCPHVFAARPVFVSSLRLRQVNEVIQAIEQTVSSPGWREHALDSAPPIARHDPRGARGVFFGYDFHLDDDKLGLIEINTNAGGAMLNVLLARAQRSCCSGVVGLSPGQEGPGGFERSILDMFAQEWSTSGEPRPLTRVVILDESPQAQYLYPEFLLFQRLFESAGIDCLIADPADLAFHNECLLVDGKPVDLVYNRLTDFYLEGDNCSALRSAYLADVVTVTPHPQAYALYADKRRLVDLTNARFWKRLASISKSEPYWPSTSRLRFLSSIAMRSTSGKTAVASFLSLSAGLVVAVRTEETSSPSGFGKKSLAETTWPSPL
ncbi:hypothetical protein [Pseudomonas sp.]|uniref:hypothetical protein n=1 Tax=Pseudomonas sp. TaxID=306 RepID=UPI003D102730